MKSSSDLFPVALMRADVVAQKFIEDTYLLKPNNSEDPSVQIALTRLGKYEGKNENRGRPVILVHGSFSNRGVWLSVTGKGFASALLEAGFDPWMLELRGHGDSPFNEQYENNSLESYANFDLPAVNAFVQEQTNQAPFWCGHSSGGVCIATSIASEKLKISDISGLILFGSQVSRFPLALRVPFFRLLSRIILIPKKRIHSKKLGVELEPVGIAKEFLRWAGIFTGWKSKSGQSYWKKLKEISPLPVLAIGAKNDKGDPSKHCKKLMSAFVGDKTFYLLSKDEGFSQNFNHSNMVASDAAQQEVWPKVIEWINSSKQ